MAGHHAHRRTPRVVRFFPEVRSAHLERSTSMAPATTLYLRARDDFDPDLEAAHPEFRRVSPVSLLIAAVRARPDVLEVPEPLWLPFAPMSWLLALVCRTASRTAGRHLRVVTYAIDNSGVDRVPRVFTGRAAAAWPLVARSLTRLGARQVDRIAFGTAGARRAYDETVGADWHGSRLTETTTLEALPTACECVDAGRKEPGRVLFLGQLHTRKGFDVLLEAWRRVGADRQGGTLVVVGDGPLAEAARDAASADPSIELLGPASRRTVHAELNRASVVVLPSQPGTRWREQVGLPLVEGVAHGCRVVTTTETGLADALAGLGHTVVPAPTPAHVLADALRAVLTRGVASDEVLADLPRVDGRVAAERWLVTRCR